MPVYTFSIKDHKAEDAKMVKDIKIYCAKHGIVFSKIVLDALKQYQKNQQNLNGKR